MSSNHLTFSNPNISPALRPYLDRLDSSSNASRERALNELFEAVEAVRRTHFVTNKDDAVLDALVASRISSKVEVVSPPVNPQSPIGISNTGNNCWASSVIQLLVNVPHLAQQLMDQKLEPLASLIRNYAEGVDSNQLRILSDDFGVGTQEDPAIALEKTLDQLGIRNELHEEFHQPNGERRESPQPQIHTMLQVSMPNGNSSLDECITGSFRSNIEDGRVSQLSFAEAPQDLFVQVKRFERRGEQQIKRDEPFTYVSTEGLELPYTCIKNGERSVFYNLTGAIIHQGTSINEGHYTTVVKRGQQWYFIDDSVVTPIEDHVAQGHLQKAYIFHYQQRSFLANCPLPPRWLVWSVAAAFLLLRINLL